MTTKGHRNSLKPGYKLHWYRITQILGQGGFGITYHARDLNLDRDVAIKEYLPVEMAVREGDYSVHPLSEAHGQQYTWGLDRFIVEARTLAKFDHPNIVRVYSVFEENNTGYMVMRYERGQSLQEKIDLERTLGESDILKVIMPILNGLEMIHQSGFIHRDIKPDNIYLREDGSPVLIDFGSARQALGEKTKTLTSLITPGYAPIEQYYSKSDEQGPWTDIYSLGATAYRAITGVGPMDALERSRTMLELQRDIFIYTNEICSGKFSGSFLNAIDHALQFRLKDRPRSISEWRHEFGFHTDRLEQTRREEAQRIVTRLGTGPSPVQEQKKIEAAAGPKSRPLRFATIALLLVLLACAAGYYFQEAIIDGVITVVMGGRDGDIFGKREQAAGQAPFAAPVAAGGQGTPGPEQQLSFMLESAGTNLAAGRLTDPQGQNALEDFLAVLAVDPDNKEAKDGVEEIFQFYIRSANNMMALSKYNEAEADLHRADAIKPGTVSVRLARLQLDEARNEYQSMLNENKLKKQQEEQQRLTVLEQQRQEQENKRIELEKQRITEQKRKLEEEQAALDAEKIRQQETRMKQAEQQRLEQQQHREEQEKQAAEQERQKAAEQTKKENPVARFLDGIIFPDVNTIYKGMLYVCNYYNEDDPNACRRNIEKCREFSQDNQDLFKYCVSEYVEKLITLYTAKIEKQAL
jgi:serine/threonine protein kinase